jgi:hypothetical protein
VTTTSTTDGPATATTIGPRNANPIANDACSVRLKTPIAVSSWARGTIRGIIEASAGVRTTVVRLMPRLSSRRTGTLAPATASPNVKAVRIAFGTIIAQRTSSRSTRTPATADNRIVGTRNDMTSALTAALERVVANTRIVSA